MAIWCVYNGLVDKETPRASCDVVVGFLARLRVIDWNSLAMGNTAPSWGRSFSEGSQWTAGARAACAPHRTGSSRRLTCLPSLRAR
eukprot:6205307-Pleurochrysis_carterae.AAC.1